MASARLTPSVEALCVKLGRSEVHRSDNKFPKIATMRSWTATEWTQGGRMGEDVVAARRGKGSTGCSHATAATHGTLHFLGGCRVGRTLPLREATAKPNLLRISDVTVDRTV
jgi:hypothetical protein